MPELICVTDDRDLPSVDDERLVVEADLVTRNGNQPLEEVIAGRKIAPGGDERSDRRRDGKVDDIASRRRPTGPKQIQATRQARACIERQPPTPE
jgi:hypothetical protein